MPPSSTRLAHLLAAFFSLAFNLPLRSALPVVAGRGVY
jgi:hypothetical protein